MGLETGSFISDLIATNPPSTDKKSQGDDHLRLIKAVLQGSFPSSSKAFYNPAAAVKTVDFTVVASDMNKTFLVTTAAGTVTGTLPTLAAGDAGWQCHFLKTNTGTNAFWIAPASGTLQSDDLSGLAKTRRVIPGVRSTALWTGSAWLVSRAVNVPVGSIIDFEGATLPVGYELPNGQTLSGSSGSVYPDYFARKGSLVTSDVTGRVVVGKEAAATRITVAGSGINGGTLGATGGVEAEAISQANLPNVNFTVDIPVGQGSHSHGLTNGTTVLQANGGGNRTETLASNSAFRDITVNAATLPALSGTAASGGSGTAFKKVMPAIILNKILVVE